MSRLPDVFRPESLVVGIMAVVANVLEIDAIGNTVCAVTGSGSSTFVMPSPRMLTTPLFSCSPDERSDVRGLYFSCSLQGALARDETDLLGRGNDAISGLRRAHVAIQREGLAPRGR